MPQITLLGMKCTTITGVATTAYPLPDWAPDIAAIATSAVAGALADSWRASTTGTLGMGLLVVPERFLKVGARCFKFSGATGSNAKGTVWSVILRYQAVGELVRT